MEGKHYCKPAQPVCACYMLADEPSEKCPIHGGAIVNRCECGRFVRPRFYGQTLEGKLAAVIVARSLIEQIFSDDRVWTCKDCGAKTTINSEICEGCGKEDCSQGTGVEV